MIDSPAIEKDESIDILDVPSKLSPEDERSDIDNRSLALINYINEQKITIPFDYTVDKHFKVSLLEQYYKVLKDLKTESAQEFGKNEIRRLACVIALRETREKLELEKQAATDKLTGLWSRAALNNFLNRLINKPRLNSQVGFILLDIDYFKKINDSKGHLEGDRVLKELARLLQENFRGADMVARFGGEEFAVVMPNIPDLEIARKNTERVRQLVSNKLGVTISGGVTTIKSGENIDQLLKRTDDYLYQAKGGGRDQIWDENGKVMPT